MASFADHSRRIAQIGNAARWAALDRRAGRGQKRHRGVHVSTRDARGASLLTRQAQDIGNDVVSFILVQDYVRHGRGQQSHR